MRRSASRKSCRLNTTVDFWRDWLSTARFRSSVEALSGSQRAHLEGAQLRPDGRDHGGGDDVAAGDLGGARNWDYRFT
jgi:hypothetical protein